MLAIKIVSLCIYVQIIYAKRCAVDIACYQTLKKSYDLSTSSNPEIAKFIEDEHNRYRSTIDPPANNMERVFWSDEIARGALNLAKKCDYNIVHSSTRDRTIDKYYLQFPMTNKGWKKEYRISEGTGCGENLSQSAVEYSKLTNFTFTWTMILKRWYEERYSCNWHHPMKINSTKCKIGHFYQIISAKTTEIGCGMAVCHHNHEATKTFLVAACHYCPQMGMREPGFPYQKRDDYNPPDTCIRLRKEDKLCYPICQDKWSNDYIKTKECLTYCSKDDYIEPDKTTKKVDMEVKIKEGCSRTCGNCSLNWFRNHLRYKHENILEADHRRQDEVMMRSDGRSRQEPLFKESPVTTTTPADADSTPKDDSSRRTSGSSDSRSDSSSCESDKALSKLESQLGVEGSRKLMKLLKERFHHPDFKPTGESSRACDKSGFNHFFLQSGARTEAHHIHWHLSLSWSIFILLSLVV